MRVLNLGLDSSILNSKSSLAKRAIEYGKLLEKYTVIVPDVERQNIKLSDNVEAESVCGKNKIFQLKNIYTLGSNILNNKKIDVITVQDQYYLALIGWLLAKKFKIGLEIQIHGFEKFAGLRKVIAKFVLPRADTARCVSQRLKKQLIKEFGVEEKKITVVPIYTSTPTNSPLPRGRERGGDKFIFLTVGRLVPVKNIEMQVEAMCEIVNSEGLKTKSKNIELWIVGSGEMSERLKVKSEKLGIEKNIKFLGYRSKEDLDKIYDQADAFLLTSNYEGWGLAVIEAAAHGLPIIMTDVGCAGEVIKDGESGVVISVGDKKGLVKNMREIINDENLRLKLGRGAQKAVEKLPSKEETLNLYLESWKNVLNN